MRKNTIGLLAVGHVTQPLCGKKEVVSQHGEVSCRMPSLRAQCRHITCVHMCRYEVKLTFSAHALNLNPTWTYHV